MKSVFTQNILLSFQKNRLAVVIFICYRKRLIEESKLGWHRKR